MASKKEILSAIVLVIFVLWLALLAGFFYANTGDTGAGNGWNWILAVTTSVGSVLFLILGMMAIYNKSRDD